LPFHLPPARLHYQPPPDDGLLRHEQEGFRLHNGRTVLRLGCPDPACWYAVPALCGRVHLGAPISRQGADRGRHRTLRPHRLRLEDLAYHPWDPLHSTSVRDHVLVVSQHEAGLLRLPASGFRHSLLRSFGSCPHRRSHDFLRDGWLPRLPLRARLLEIRQSSLLGCFPGAGGALQGDGGLPPRGPPDVSHRLLSGRSESMGLLTREGRNTRWHRLHRRAPGLRLPVRAALASDLHTAHTVHAEVRCVAHRSHRTVDR